MKKEILRKLIQNSEYMEADKFLNRNIVLEEYDDEIAILDAAIGIAYGDRDRVWKACANGLTLNPYNYELYVILAEYYMSINSIQAYLCLENALFFCLDEKDKEEIVNMQKRIVQEYQITIRGVSIVLLSHNNIDVTRSCIESIRSTISENIREIIVVDNGSTDDSVRWLRDQKDVILVENNDNKGFPKGCNQGIEVASPYNDIFLLNNDTILTDNSIFWLRMGLYENEKIGAVGSVSNYCGNLQRIQVTENYSIEKWLQFGRKNNVPMENPYEEKLYLTGFALLIKRVVLEKVGYLDERFTPGNFEDNDYGLRILKEGYKNILCRNSFIFHYGSMTFREKADEYKDIISINRKKFYDKWKIDTRRYFDPATDVASFITNPKGEKIRILEIGCGCGALLAHIKGKYPNAVCYGIEKNKETAEIGACITEVIWADIEEMDIPWDKESFDYIILDEIMNMHIPLQREANSA